MLSTKRPQIRSYFSTRLFFSYSIRQRLPIYLLVSGFIALTAFAIALFHPIALLPKLVVGIAYFCCFGGASILVSEVRILYLRRRQKEEINFAIGELWIIAFILFLIGFIFLGAAQTVLMNHIPIDLSYYSDPANGFLPFSFLFFIKMIPPWIIDVLLASHVVLKKVHSPSIQDSESEKADILEIQADKKSFKLNPNNVSHISVEQHYTTIYLHTADGPEEMEIKSSLKKLMEQLPEDTFVQPHRSHLVNLDFVEKIVSSPDGGKIRLKYSDKTVPVSRRQITTIKETHLKHKENRICQTAPFNQGITN